MPNAPYDPQDPQGPQDSRRSQQDGERRGRRERGEQRYSDTPFARVLTAYMWSKTPPWSVPKTAAVLGVHRTRVNNWIYYDIVPETDAMIAVMAKLGIPMSRLLDAYAEAGLPVPPLTEEDARAVDLEPEQVNVPNARRGRGGGVNHSTGRAVAPSPTSGTTSGPISGATAAPTATAASADEWETMIAHTRQVMTSMGMPEALVEGMLAHIARTRSGMPSEAERRAAEEFSEQQPSGEPVEKRRSGRSPRRSPSGPIESETR